MSASPKLSTDKTSGSAGMFMEGSYSKMSLGRKMHRNRLEGTAIKRTAISGCAYLLIFALFLPVLAADEASPPGTEALIMPTEIYSAKNATVQIGPKVKGGPQPYVQVPLVTMMVIVSVTLSCLVLKHVNTSIPLLLLQRMLQPIKYTSQFLSK